MKTLYFESMICLLLSRSTILIRAARSVSVLSPVVERLPEAASVLRDDSKVAKMTQDLLASSTSMQHVPEEDRTKQYVEYHIPTYEYLSTLLQRHRAKDSARPLFVGVSAPQVVFLSYFCPNNTAKTFFVSNLPVIVIRAAGRRPLPVLCATCSAWRASTALQCLSTIFIYPAPNKSSSPKRTHRTTY